jgi:hypothetical protein
LAWLSVDFSTEKQANAEIISWKSGVLPVVQLCREQASDFNLLLIHNSYACTYMYSLLIHFFSNLQTLRVFCPPN